MLQLFALQATRDLGARIATHLGHALAAHEEREFQDGEHKLRPLVDVRGADAFVVQSLHGDADSGAADKLVRLLFFAAALRDHGAARVTAVVPYLAYARKDRRTQPFDPVTSRYVAQLVEAMHIDRVVAFEVHNVAAFDNAFRMPALHVSSDAVLAPQAARLVGDRRAVVASPDPGGVKRAQLFGETLAKLLGRDCGSAFMEKRRTGDVRGAVVVLVDDLISTGTTLVRAARACVEQGAAGVIACVAHGLFAQGSAETLHDAALSSLLITDSVVPSTLPALGERLQVISAAPLLAETIATLHGGVAPGP